MDPADRIRGMSFGSERAITPGFAPVRAPGLSGGFASGGVGGVGGFGSPADPMMAEFIAQYVNGWSAREMAWGMQGLMEAVQRAQGVALPGTPGQTPFDLPTAPATAAPTQPSDAPPAGSWQALADEMGVRPRRAQRETRAQQRADRADANGGTITTGDIGPNADVSLTANAGTAKKKQRVRD